MANIFLISDTHFGHAGILKFTARDGTLLRPQFSCVEEMNEHMVERWNAVVRPQDHVYHLGDFAIGKQNIPIAARLNGHKRLVLGNHDEPDMKLYAPYFKKIFSSRKLDNFILTHIPVHPEDIGKCIANIHGHIHNNVPQWNLGPRYFNVSCELLDYTPVPLEEIKATVKDYQAVHLGTTTEECYGTR